jgi:hypothetical protein
MSENNIKRPYDVDNAGNYITPCPLYPGRNIANHSCQFGCTYQQELNDSSRFVLCSYKEKQRRIPQPNDVWEIDTSEGKVNYFLTKKRNDNNIWDAFNLHNGKKAIANLKNSRWKFVCNSETIISFLKEIKYERTQ